MLKCIMTHLKDPENEEMCGFECEYLRPKK